MKIILGDVLSSHLIFFNIGTAPMRGNQMHIQTPRSMGDTSKPTHIFIFVMISVYKFFIWLHVYSFFPSNAFGCGYWEVGM